MEKLESQIKNKIFKKSISVLRVTIIVIFEIIENFIKITEIVLFKKLDYHKKCLNKML